MANEFLQDKVKRYLKDNGMMQKFFAEKIGVSQPVLSMWLRDQTSLKHKTIAQIREIVDNDKQ